MVGKRKSMFGHVIRGLAAVSVLVTAVVSVSHKITEGVGTLRTARRAVAEAYTNKPKYLLTFEQAAPMRNPTGADIADAVDRMESGREGFVVLARSDNDENYIQAARDSRNKYEFEYSTYVADSAYELNLFQCKGTAKARTVRVAMTDYARGGRSWIHSCSWKRMKL
jgi:hypothetical protein